MALDICNYTPMVNCLLESSNDRFAFIFSQICSLINNTTPPYTLPCATDTTLGGIKVGDGLIMDPTNCTLSVIPTFVTGSRFGIEDNLSTQNRQVDMGGNIFEIFSNIVNQYGAIYMDNSSVSVTASDGVTSGGFDSIINGCRVFGLDPSNNISKELFVTTDSVQVVQSDLSNTYVQTFPISNGFLVTSVNNVPADATGNVVLATTLAGLQDVITNNPSLTGSNTIDGTDLILDLNLEITGSLKATGIDIQETPLNLLWRDSSGFIHEAAIPSVSPAPLTDGQGTTVGSDLTSIDLGGTISQDITINSDTPATHAFGIGNLNSFAQFDLLSTNINIDATNLILNASSGSLKFGGIDVLGSPTNVLWQDGSGFIHKSTFPPIPTLQQVTTAGGTSIPSITIGASTSPTSKLDIVNSSLGITPAYTSGISLINAAAATAILEQTSPVLNFQNNQWDAFAGSRSTHFKIYNKGIDSGNILTAGTASSQLIFESDTSGSIIQPLKLTTSGNATFGNGITFDLFGVPRIVSASRISYQALSATGIQHSFTNALGSSLTGTVVDVNSGYFTNSTALSITSNFGRNTLTTLSNGSVGINTTTPNSHLALDVQSVGKGFRPPLMTTAQRDGINQYLATIPVTSGGSNYTIAPTVNIAAPAGGGLSAVATSILTAGSVSSILIYYGGTSYSSIPAVSLTSNPSDINIGIIVPAVLGTPTISTDTIPTGTTIYNTEINSGDGGLQYFNGTIWKTLATV